MTATEFNRRLAAAGISGRAVEAARRVLVDGLGLNEAARQVAVDKAAVSRAAARLRDLKICRRCGQAL